jgi:hypothetical protein
MTVADDPQPARERNLEQKVGDWLAREGYPLEFLAANIFKAAGFAVRQGYHVRDESAHTVREVDVLASATAEVGDSLLRIYHVLECKYSRDKPWVVFTSDQPIAPSACVAQTFGTMAGQALLWALAGHQEIQGLSYFATPGEPGFGGRQALSDNRDIFYDALQAVVSKATAVMRQYDNPYGGIQDALEIAAIAFPLIVVDGRLFSAAFNERTKEMDLAEVEVMRLHWRGAASWRMHATIDIVTSTYLTRLAAQRYKELDVLIPSMHKCLSQLQRCLVERTLDPLEVFGGAKDSLGLPLLLSQMKAQFESRALSPSSAVADT